MSNQIIFKAFLEHEFSRMPQKAHSTDAGYDLSSCEHITIPPKQWKVVDTGIRFEIPEGYEIQIRPRSGLAAKKGVTVLNSPGTIDSNFTNHVKIILINHGEFPFEIAPGDRIAQAVMAPVLNSIIQEIEYVPTSEIRGDAGFGSTGIAGPKN